MENSEAAPIIKVETQSPSCLMESDSASAKMSKWKNTYDKNRKYNKKWENEFEWLSPSDDGCYCEACKMTIKTFKRSNLVYHQKSAKHLKNLKSFATSTIPKRELVDVNSHFGFEESNQINNVSLNPSKRKQTCNENDKYNKEWEKKFEWLSCRNNKCYCSVCDETIKTLKKNSLTYHEKTARHMKNSESIAFITIPTPEIIENQPQFDSGDSEVLNMPLSICNSENTNKENRNYKKDWEKDFDWLICKNSSCYCKVCNVAIRNKRSNLILHKNSRRHITRAAALPKQKVKYRMTKSSSKGSKIKTWKKIYESSRRYNKLWEKEFKWLSYRDNACYCTVCDVPIKALKKCRLMLHEQSKYHMRNAATESHQKIHIFFGKSFSNTASNEFEVTYDDSFAHSQFNTMKRWQGRVALVTGASAGIGAAICKQLVKAGMIVIGAARGVERVEALAQELQGQPGKLAAVKCDLTNDADVLSMFEFIKREYKGVDVCINNAGMSHNKSLLDGSTEEWREMLNINVVSLCLCTREAIKSMKERGVDDGHIIHVNSMSGHRVTTNPGTHFYTATKHAVTGLTEGLRQELRALKSHIRVSAISPGIVETEFAPRMAQDDAAGKSFYGGLKCLQADDIATSVVHILEVPAHMEIHDILVRPTEQVS